MKFSDIFRTVPPTPVMTADDLAPRAPPTSRIVVPSQVNSRMYHNARQSRLTSGWSQGSSSADVELSSSLRMLRDRSRALVRDASYAKRARTLVVNNVVGSGIGMQGAIKTNDGKLNTRLNDAVELAWENWCIAEHCHTGGRLHFSHLERAAMGQVFDAGEVFIRLHPLRMGGSDIPLALELIEAERIPDDLSIPYLGSIQNGNELRLGIELESQFLRPVAYYVRSIHPSEYRFANRNFGQETVDRVDASVMIHLSIIDRWPQTRGEPWMHTAARRLNDMDAYSEAEIIRSRVQALNPGAIETPEDPASWAEKKDDGSYEMEMEAGVYKRLLPGEKLVPGSVNSPNPGLDGFMRYMLREIAAGVGVSYESLSRDYSQSNYSSSRLALLDDRDLWRFFQSWFIKTFREVIHKAWLNRAVLARAIPALPADVFAADPLKYGAVKFKPRGWTWIDPTSEIDAYVTAVEAGFTTVSDVIAATGGGQDLEDVLLQREIELEAMQDKGLVFTTSPDVYDKEEPKPVAQPQQAQPAQEGGATGEGQPAAQTATQRRLSQWK